MKKICIVLCLCLAALLVLPGCAGEKQLTRVRLSEVTHSVFYAPQYVAMELGFFAEEGLAIELTNGGGADKVMTAVFIKEAYDDYTATAENNGRTLKHRLGCSGIDGTTIAPGFGAEKKDKHIYLAYGVYDDTLRTDNDYQVLLAYDTKDWKRFEQPLSQGSLHKSGPAAPDHKYFVRTGNTSWGIQNLAYDPASGNCYAAVYKGKKSQYPNYSLFVIDGGKPARRELLQGFDTPTEGEVLSLVPAGKSAGGIYGWDFKWGTTGLCPLGGGYFYISQNARSKETKQQSSTVRLYRWTGDADAPFRPVE